MRTIVSFLAAMFLLVGCGSSDSGHRGEPQASSLDARASEKGVFSASMVWNEPLKASRTETMSGVLTITKEDGSAPSTVQIDGFHPEMPGMGHGTNEQSQKFTLVEGTTNKFDVTGVIFIMGGSAGEWVVVIQATVDGEADSVTLPVPEVN